MKIRFLVTVLLIICIAGCKKKESTTPVAKNLPTVTTSVVDSIDISSARCGGTITSDGGQTVTLRGVCWGTDTNNLTVTGTKTVDGTGTGTFISKITGLTAGTIYYVRAYATSVNGTGYGSIRSFPTLSNLPVPIVSTGNVDSITNITAICEGNVIFDGGKLVSARGICWSTDSNNVTIAGNKSNDGQGEGTFKGRITGLTYGTTYYARAYATSSNGTGYGERVTFTTMTIPVLTTNDVNMISAHEAVSGGNITSDGGLPIISRGICRSRNPNPTIADTLVTAGSGTGNFSCIITGLSQQTLYYARAYATNLAGTAYGQSVSFTTKEDTSSYPNLIEMKQWVGTPDNGYYQCFDNVYGVVYDLSSFPVTFLCRLDFHHASWGTTGIWQYNIHVVDWNTYTEITVLGPLFTTGDDHWEENIPLGDITGMGGHQVAILLEPLSNEPTNAYPILSGDNIGPDGASIMGALGNFAGMGPSSVGDFLMNLWIAVPSKSGMKSIIPGKINAGEVLKALKRNTSKVRTRK